MDSNNLNGQHALNLSKHSASAGNMQRNNGSASNGSKSGFKSQPPQSQQPNFDLLASFGGDLQTAVAALAAASAASAGGAQDVAALASQYNALAQFASNPKLAATMLQLQQQNLLGQSSLASLAPPPPPPPSIHQSNSQSNLVSLAPPAASGSSMNKPNYTRYQQLLSVVDEMGKDLRTTYLGNKNSMERLKRGIASARILVKDCQMECDRNTKN